MRRSARLVGPLIFAASACTAADPSFAPAPMPTPTPTDNTPMPCATPACTPLDPVPPYSGDHPLDAAVNEAFFRAGVTFEPAGELELCRRLSADLLGKLPTREDFARDCEGKSADAIVRDFQTRDRYFLNSERHWQDRFDSNDVFSDWRYQKSLFALVDALHRSELKYGDFAIEVLAHPGFVLQDFVPEDMSRRSFRAFLGRSPTDAEAGDLAALYRPWVPAQVPDPDFPSIYMFAAYLAPSLCEPISSCTASLFGGATMNIPSSPFVSYIAYEDLSPLQLDALKQVGRLFSRQAFFWEAEADAILSRFLGWSDGGRFPREPGVVLPELRQALAEYLQNTGDVPGAERLVLTSWLYRQKTNVEPDGLGDDPHAGERPIFAYGPVKPASAETWLDSVAPLTFINIGTCDPRYPDFYGFVLLYDAFMRGAITSTAALGEELLKMYQLQETRASFTPGEYGYLEPNGYYSYYARLLGGCPGFGTPRGEAAGLAYGFAQETFAELACTYAYNASPPREERASTEQILDYQMNILFARSAAEDERASVRAALNTCSGDDCTQAGIIRSLCTALTGSSEMLFY